MCLPIYSKYFSFSQLRLISPFGVLRRLSIIDCTNDMEYVGQTTRSVEERFKEHMKSPFLIGKVIRARGEENFVIAILKECDSKNDLDHWEKKFVKLRNTMFPNGYNLTEGGDGGGIPCDETRTKMSESHRGEKNYNYGVPMSNKQREKISAAHKGKSLSPETCAKMSAARRGKKRKPFSVEHRINLSVALDTPHG